MIFSIIAILTYKMNSDWVFDRMMPYLINNDFKNAKNSAISDMNKYDDNPLSFMIINTATDNDKLIKIMAGFSSMSDKIKVYESIPEKAYIDYKIE